MWLTAIALAGAGSLEGRVTTERKASVVVVYVDGEGPPLTEQAHGRVVEQGLEFRPDALVIGKGSLVEFENKDIVNHHVYSLSPDNDFEIPEYGHDERRSVRFDAAGVVDVQCNIHKSMSTQLLVLPNAWYAVADATGAWRIEGVAAGARTVVIWAPGHVEDRREVTVTDAASVVVDARLERRPTGIQQVDKDGHPRQYTK